MSTSTHSDLLGSSLSWNNHFSPKMWHLSEHVVLPLLCRFQNQQRVLSSTFLPPQLRILISDLIFIFSKYSHSLQRKSHLCNLFWELRSLSPNFHIHVSVRDLHIPRLCPHISCSRIGRSIVGIYKSLTDTWMWKSGRAVPFLGIFVSNFRYWFFAAFTFKQKNSNILTWRSPRF